VGVALVVLSLLGCAWLWLRDSSVVAVEEVSVLGASGPRAGDLRETLIEAAADMTTLHVRMDALREASAPFPKVADLRVARDLPDRLTIRVVERTPVAALAAGERRLAVGADGTLLPGEPAARLATVPVAQLPAGETLAGGPARTAVAVLAAAPAPLRARAVLTRRAERGWAVALGDGPVVHLGTSEGLAAKWASAVAVLADPSSGGAAYVDVRMPERPVAGGLAPLPGEEDDDADVVPGAGVVPATESPADAPATGSSADAPATGSSADAPAATGTEGVTGETAPPGALSPPAATP